MGKKVKYNGETMSWKGSFDDPSVLVTNQTYELNDTEVHSDFTYYELKGFPGLRFNSCWFTETEQKVYLAQAHKIPQVGEVMKDFIRIGADQKFTPCGSSSKIDSLEKICERVYKVTTQNSIYIVQVL